MSTLWTIMAEYVFTRIKVRLNSYFFNLASKIVVLQNMNLIPAMNPFILFVSRVLNFYTGGTTLPRDSLIPIIVIYS